MLLFEVFPKGSSLSLLLMWEKHHFTVTSLGGCKALYFPTRIHSNAVCYLTPLRNLVHCKFIRETAKIAKIKLINCTETFSCESALISENLRNLAITFFNILKMLVLEFQNPDLFQKWKDYNFKKYIIYFSLFFLYLCSWGIFCVASKPPACSHVDH